MNNPPDNLILPKRHSRLGIAATVIAVVLPILLILFIISGAFLTLQTGTTGNHIAVSMLVISLTFPLIHLLGLIFGIIGLFSKKTKKIFPVIGTLINGLLILAGLAVTIFFVTNLKFKG